MIKILEKALIEHGFVTEEEQTIALDIILDNHKYVINQRINLQKNCKHDCCVSVYNGHSKVEYNQCVKCGKKTAKQKE